MRGGFFVYFVLLKLFFAFVPAFYIRVVFGNIRMLDDILRPSGVTKSTNTENV